MEQQSFFLEQQVFLEFLKIYASNLDARGNYFFELQRSEVGPQREASLQSALACYKWALEIKQILETPDSSLNFVESYALIGNIFSCQRKYGEAITMYQKALDVICHIPSHNISDEIVLRFNMSIVYTEMIVQSIRQQTEEKLNTIRSNIEQKIGEFKRQQEIKQATEIDTLQQQILALQQEILVLRQQISEEKKSFLLEGYKTEEGGSPSPFSSQGLLSPPLSPIPFSLESLQSSSQPQSSQLTRGGGKCPRFR